MHLCFPVSAINCDNKTARTRQRRSSYRCLVLDNRLEEARQMMRRIGVVSTSPLERGRTAIRTTKQNRRRLHVKLTERLFIHIPLPYAPVEK